MLKIDIDGNVLITGGGGGIGLECGVTLAQAGAKTIVFADINLKAAQFAAEASKEFAGNPDYRALAIQVDICDEKSVAQMMAFVVEECGRLDYAVNAAGVKQNKYIPCGDSDVNEFRRIMDINVTGIMICTRAQLKQMSSQTPRTMTGRSGSRDIGRGSIVILASAHSFAALYGKVAYTTSKHALTGLVKNAALDYAKEGIRVNSVCPTWVTTRLTQEERNSPDVQRAIKATTPINRMAEAEEVAESVAFLLSPAAAYITGISLLMDAAAGLSMRHH